MIDDDKIDNDALDMFVEAVRITAIESMDFGLGEPIRTGPLLAAIADLRKRAAKSAEWRERNRVLGNTAAHLRDQNDALRKRIDGRCPRCGADRRHHKDGDP